MSRRLRRLCAVGLVAAAVILFADGFLGEAFFRLAAFVLLAAFCREAVFRKALFREIFFLEGLLREAILLVVDFLLDVTFFFDDLFADAFLLLTVPFLPAVFFRVARLRDTAFLPAVRVFLRLLLAVFFAGISQILPDRKGRDYTPVGCAWKGLYGRFFADFGG